MLEFLAEQDPTRVDQTPREPSLDSIESSEKAQNMDVFGRQEINSAKEGRKDTVSKVAAAGLFGQAEKGAVTPNRLKSEAEPNSKSEKLFAIEKHEENTLGINSPVANT